MAWQMPTQGQWGPGIGMTPDMNMGTYTSDQWTAMQQQNWQQWAQWQQQYAQWQSQYGEKYTQQMQAMQSMTSMPPLPPTNAPPPAPPPPDQPPPPPHENNQPLFGVTSAPVPVPPPTQTQNRANIMPINVHPTAGKDQWSYGAETPMSSVNSEALKKLAEEEKLFDIQFRKWEDEIEKWRRENVNHPDKEAYNEYEQKFEACRAQLMERRQQMKQKRARLMGNAQTTSTPMTGNAPSPAPTQNTSNNNYNQHQSQNYNNEDKKHYNQKIYQQKQQYNNAPPSSSFNKGIICPQDRPESYEDLDNYSANDNYQQENSNFLQTSTSTSKGIPGLDLVPDSEKPSTSQQEVIDITEEHGEQIQKNNQKPQQPDYTIISKGINNILGDEKIMNILSMVRSQPPPIVNSAQQNSGNMYSQNSGNIAFQNSGNIPFQNSGNLPFQNSGNMPPQNSGNMPPQNSGNMPPQNSGNNNHYSNQNNQMNNQWNRNDNYNQQYHNRQNNNVHFNNRQESNFLQQNQGQFNRPPPPNQNQMYNEKPPNTQNQYYNDNSQHRGQDTPQNNNQLPMRQNVPPPKPLMELNVQQPMQRDFSRLPPNRAITESVPPPNPPIKKWVEEPLFTPSILVEYEHKALRLKARDFIEPVHMFDYNHKSKDGENKTRDFKMEADELFLRKLRREPDTFPQERYARDHYSKDYERRVPREENREDYHYRPPRMEYDDRRRADDRYDDRRRDDRYSRREDSFRERDREYDKDLYRDRFRDVSRREDRSSSASRERDSRKRDHSRDSHSTDSSKKPRDQNGTEKYEQPKHIVMIDDILEPPGREMRPEKIVIILRGPPGSGKSYLAKLIRDKEAEYGSTTRIMSIDDYFMQEGEVEVKDQATGKIIKKPTLKYEYDEALEESYLTSLKRAFKRSLTDGYFTFLIYDAVNEHLKSYADVWNLARQNGFQVYVCTMELDPNVCFKRNCHNRSLSDIEVICARFFPTPAHHIQLDATTLLQSAAITEVQMEDAEDEVIMEDAQETEVESVFTSKWEKMDDAAQLARLDGTSKPLRSSQLSMEDYLQLDDWTPTTAKPGKKTVRWADIEERRQQEKMRAIGFVVGQTDWNRMTDPTMGSSALTQTKYIERVKRI